MRLCKTQTKRHRAIAFGCQRQAAWLVARLATVAGMRTLSTFNWHRAIAAELPLAAPVFDANVRAAPVFHCNAAHEGRVDQHAVATMFDGAILPGLKLVVCTGRQRHRPFVLKWLQR